jgi:hypothetical protein
MREIGKVLIGSIPIKILKDLALKKNYISASSKRN